MSRYRLDPTFEQEIILRRHCDGARYIWNLALEQRKCYRTGGRRLSPPNKAERSRQLTEARAENKWLAQGSIIIQQQALRDFDQALVNFFNHTHGFLKWRKAGRSEGFRVTKFEVSDVRVLNKNIAEMRVPKIGYVRFRYSREIDFTNVKSYRVTLNPAGQWHVAFAIIPEPITSPGTGEIIGIDVGIVNTIALSNGEFYRFKSDPKLDKRIKGLQRALARSKRDSNRRKVDKLKLAKAQLKKANKRKDSIEKTTTELARSFDYFKREDLRIVNMTKSAKGTLESPGRNVKAKAGLNREILNQAWGIIFNRLERKAPGRVIKVVASFTSIECLKCNNKDKKNRESQAIFKCVQCGFTMHADTKASITIVEKTAAGHAVGFNPRGLKPIARRGATASLKREPQVTLVA